MSASSAASSVGSPIHIAFGRWLFSSIGKKTVVAVTGVLLVLFVIAHLLGNLTIFAGPDWINGYAVHLRDFGPLLWIARIGLLLAVGLHIYFSMLVWKENAAAKPQKYAVFAPMKTSIFARTMRLTGLFVLAFVIFHLAQFTLLIVDPNYSTFHTRLNGNEVHDVYRMVVVGFSQPIVSVFYILALFFLCFHLSHGIGSLFQTLGLSNGTMRTVYETGARVVAWLLFLGYASIPVAVLVFGLGKDYIK
jgi:succinate dehydrogenase / fumarate reductase, cytochrome b subunit